MAFFRDNLKIHKDYLDVGCKVQLRCSDFLRYRIILAYYDGDDRRDV